MRIPNRRYPFQKHKTVQRMARATRVCEANEKLLTIMIDKVCRLTVTDPNFYLKKCRRSRLRPRDSSAIAPELTPCYSIPKYSIAQKLALPVPRNLGFFEWAYGKCRLSCAE